MVAMAVGGGVTPGRAAATAGSTYSAILINNFMGNTWRPIMMRTAQVLAAQPPLKSRISHLRLVVTDNTPASENAAINAAILAHPDVLLIDAASPTASNQVIQQACNAGITVVSFDVLVTAPCAWKIAVDFKSQGAGQAKFVATAMGGKGTILMDKAFQGAQSVNDWLSGANSVLKAYPGITVKSFYGGGTPGGEQSGIAALLSSTPQVGGLLIHGFGAYGLKALQAAGRKPVPTAGFSYNLSLQTCLALKIPCLLYSSPTWVSGSAMRLGIAVRDGKMGKTPTTVLLNAPWFTNDPSITFPTAGYPVLSIEKEVLPSVNGGIMLPLSPAWAKLTTGEVLAKPTIGG